MKDGRGGGRLGNMVQRIANERGRGGGEGGGSGTKESEVILLPCCGVCGDVGVDGVSR